MHQKLSVIVPYYNNLERVQRQLELWESLPKTITREVEFILIDDCSEQSASVHSEFLNIKHFRIKTDIDWNQPGARNLGAFVASGEWALFYDVDQLPTLEGLALIIERLNELHGGFMYFFRIKELINPVNGKPLEYHPSTFLIRLPLFKWHVMFDEDFSGHYGYDDLYMHAVWEKFGGKFVLLNDVVFFEDLESGTPKLSRNLQRNAALEVMKRLAGSKKPAHFLRFEWEQVFSE
jgi:glycosyltransferase involved in cell wall biosynthesis